MSLQDKLKPSASKYKNGYYEPINASKYIGKTPIVYRSGLELDWYKRFDTADEVLKWSVEPADFVVPYIFEVDGIHKKKRYHVDVYLELSTGIKVIAEIKPLNKLFNPLKHNATTTKARAKAKAEFKTYRQNVAKWVAAKKFAQDRKMSFAILTEEGLRKHTIFN